MANPNRAMAHVAKNPWTHVGQSNSRADAYARRDAMAEAEPAYNFKVTQSRLGPRGDHWLTCNIWKRIKPAKQSAKREA